MTRVGIYTRLSQDRDGKAASPARQEAESRELAERHGWQVVGVYEDRDLSGYTGKRRPGFERLLADVKSGRLDGIVAWKLDRLQRNRRDYFRLTELLDAGMQLGLVADPVDTTTAMGGVVLDLLAGMARAESANISARVRLAFDDRAKKGKPHWSGGRPFGYDEQHRIIPDEAKAVQAAAKAILSGGTLGQVVRDLNAAGVTTARGNLWTSAQLGAMLRRPTLAGLRAHHGVLHEGTWPAILDRATWERLKATLDRNRPKGGGRRAHLLTGLARCAECGSGMMSAKNGKGVPRYCCRVEVRGCGKVGILGSGLDEYVTEHVLTALDGPALRRMQAARKDTGGAADALAQLDDLQDRMDQLVHDRYVEQIVPEAAFRKAQDELTRRMAELQGQVAVDFAAVTLAGLPSDLRGWWAEAPLNRRRDVLDAVLVKVEVGKVRRGGRGFDAERVNLVWAG